MGTTLFSLVWYLAAIIILFFIGNLLYSQVKQEFTIYYRENGKNQMSGENLLDGDAEMTHNRNTDLVEVFRMLLGTFSIIAAFLLFFIIYSFANEIFYERLQNLEKSKEIFYPIISIIFFTAGISFSRGIIFGKRGGDEDSPDKLPKNSFYQRRGLIEGFLAFIFLAIVYIAVTDFGLKSNVLKMLSSSFIVGSIFYIISRFNRKN